MRLPSAAPGALRDTLCSDVPQSYEYLKKHNPKVWGLEWNFVDDALAAAPDAPSAAPTPAASPAPSAATSPRDSSDAEAARDSAAGALDGVSVPHGDVNPRVARLPATTEASGEARVPAQWANARRIYLWVDNPRAGEVKLSQSFDARRHSAQLQVVALTTLSELSEWLARYGHACKTKLRVIVTWHRADDLEYAAAKQLVETLRRSKHWYPLPVLIYSERKVRGDEFITYDFPGVTLTSDPKALLALANPEARSACLAAALPAAFVISPLGAHCVRREAE